jgi:hypothetical protein
MFLVFTLLVMNSLQSDAVTWEAINGTWNKTQPTTSISGFVSVLKKDAFGAEPPRADISFKDSNGTRLQAYLPGTLGNAGRFVPMTLRHGLYVTFTGYRETNNTAATAMKIEMSDAGLLAGRAADLSSSTAVVAALDKRPIFVVTSLTYAIPPARRLDNTSIREVKAIVVLFEPCGQKLDSKTTLDRVQNSIFSPNIGSFYSTFRECTRNMVTITGAVKGPIAGCPKSQDAYDIYDSVDAVLKGDPDWNDKVHKLMILPSSWLSSIGLGEIGGYLSWYQESYIDSPQLYFHELGHNLLLHHSSLAYTKDEYKDTSSAMAFCCNTVCYNFIHSWQLGIAEFLTEFRAEDLLNSATSTWISLPALSANVSSGVKISGFTTGNQSSFIVLSYRSTSGFDRYLSGTSHANRVQVSHWRGQSRDDSVLTYLLDQAVGGQTIAIMDTDEDSQRIDTGLKMTVNDAVGDSASVFVCNRNGTMSPCQAPFPGSGASPAPPPAPAPPPSFSMWTDYFSNQISSEMFLLNRSLFGVGCQGMFCASMRLQYRTDVEISSMGTTVGQLDADIGSLICNAGQVVSSITCLSGNCSRFRVLCSFPSNGRLAGKPQDMSWFPQLHQEGNSTCKASDVLVGIRCSSARCASKMLFCDTFIAGTPGKCVPNCGQYRFECGDNGCGGSCGSCPSSYGQEGACNTKVGRCLYTFETTWATSGLAMLSTNLISTGMRCTSDYCGNVKLIQTSISVDASFSQDSMWISDNTWKKYFFQSNSGDTTGAECTPGMAVTLVECSGSMCENIRFKCGKPYHWIVDQTRDAVVTEWFSEEDGGKMECPAGMVVTGLECKELIFFCVTKCGNHCDFKRLHCRNILPQRTGSANLGVLAQSMLATVIPNVDKTGSWWQAQVSAAKVAVVAPALILLLLKPVYL